MKEFSILVLVALGILGAAAYPLAYRASVYDAVVTVDARERVQDRVNMDGQTSSRYLVFTDQGVFEVTDTWLFFDFSASDRYAALKPGFSYRIEAAGWRVPILSMYPNIITVEGPK